MKCPPHIPGTLLNHGTTVFPQRDEGSFRSITGFLDWMAHFEEWPVTFLIKKEN